MADDPAEMLAQGKAILSQLGLVSSVVVRSSVSPASCLTCEKTGQSLPALRIPTMTTLTWMHSASQWLRLNSQVQATSLPNCLQRELKDAADMDSQPAREAVSGLGMAPRRNRKLSHHFRR